MKNLFNNNKEFSLSGKWIHLLDILPLLRIHKTHYQIVEIGKSFLKNPIYSITLGNGPIKILIWTQMHGNEATATKVVFDLLNVFKNQNTPNNIKAILELCTIKIIPILNPDGALDYTRFNAQQIDLNRDATSLIAPESKLLRQVLNSFHPDFCFNLHDQRNIYSVAQTKEPASISFLSPSTEFSRKLTNERLKSMAVISTMFQALKIDIPKNVSRYNDAFYPNATGDNFQKDGFSTILIEAGHFQDDYNREKVRYFYFKSLLTGLLSISTNSFADIEIYNEIPQNDTYYLDIIINNVLLKSKNISVGILFAEQIKDGKLIKIPTIEKIGDLSAYGANTIINAENVTIDSENDLNSLFKIFN